MSATGRARLASALPMSGDVICLQRIPGTSASKALVEDDDGGAATRHVEERIPSHKGFGEGWTGMVEGSEKQEA